MISSSFGFRAHVLVCDGGEVLQDRLGRLAAREVSEDHAHEHASAPDHGLLHFVVMGGSPLKATDLLPLAQKLSLEERLRLAKILLSTSTLSGDAAAYAAQPPHEDELGTDDEALGWEGHGWQEFYEAG